MAVESYNPNARSSPEYRKEHCLNQKFRKGSLVICRYPGQYAEQFTYGKVYKIANVERNSGWIEIEEDDSGRWNGWGGHHFINTTNLTDVEKAIYGV